MVGLTSICHARQSSLGVSLVSTLARGGGFENDVLLCIDPKGQNKCVVYSSSQLSMHVTRRLKLYTRVTATRELDNQIRFGDD